METSLDFGFVFTPKTQDLSLKLSQINSYLEKLEEEKRKIDVFKRELPFSKLLLTDVIGRLKEEAMICRKSMSLKRKFDDETGAKQENDKKAWMSTARLWISNSPVKMTGQEDDAFAVENQINGDAIPPFEVQSDHHQENSNPFATSEMNFQAVHIQIDPQNNPWNPPERKERRRWSPALHRKFVEALEILGGHSDATPKQIREVMQVKGLTNDEVKSHLQKYRINIKKGKAVEDSSSADRNPQSILLRGSSSNEPNSSESEEISDGKSWKFL